MEQVILTTLSLFSSILCIRSKYTGSTLQLYLFKPLTTILIIAIAVLSLLPSPDAYGFYLLLGLFFCLWGDVFLMFPGNGFIAGLVSFLLAHVLFITGFVVQSGFGFSPSVGFPLFVLAAAFSFVILPHTGKIKTAVLIYIAVISIMAWQAWERYQLLGTANTMAAGAGAALFLLSDFILAYNKFRKPFKMADALVLGTYFPAVWLLAISIST